MKLRIYTWNLGLSFFYKYAHYFNIKIHGAPVRHEYFQVSHTKAIRKQILEINPDICVVQEIHDDEDFEKLELRNEYPHQTLIDGWYHKHAIGVLSKKPFTEKRLSNIFTQLTLEDTGIHIIPIHLHSFSSKIRNSQIKELLSLVSNKKAVILGDTNFWSRHNFFFNKNDKKSYKNLTKKFVDSTKYKTPSSKVGFSFDRIFLSRNIELLDAECWQKNETGMDHYPVWVDIEV